MCPDRCKRGNVETYMCSSQHGLAPGKAGRSCRTVMRANRAAWGARMSAARCGHQWLDVCACKRPRGCVTLPIGTGVRSVGSGSAGPVLVIPASSLPLTSPPSKRSREQMPPPPPPFEPPSPCCSPPLAFDSALNTDGGQQAAAGKKKRRRSSQKSGAARQNDAHGKQSDTGDANH